VFYDSRKSQMHVWEQVKGQNMYDVLDWAPYVYVKTDDGNAATLDGQKAKKVYFKSYLDYYTYSKTRENLLENAVKPEIQFLTERYHGIRDDELEVPKLCIYSIDIEVPRGDSGFSDVNDADDPVVLISICNNLTNRTTTFGMKPYNGEYKDKDFLTYVYCETEEELFQRVFNFFQKFPCDVVTGWNVQGYDVPYLVNRARRLFGDDTDVYRKFSPIGQIRMWKGHDQKGNEILNIDIGGVTILDYMDLYKWYSPSKLESYSLKFVTAFELDKTKVDYSEYEDLRDLYERNWDLYVKYNIIDAYRILQLEEKLGYIMLVQALSLLCRASMKYYHVMTQLIEGLLITYFRRHGMCGPRFYGGTQETFEAAFVKEPKVGRYEWISDLDIASSYPTAVLTLNMSPETYYGRIRGLTEEQVMHNVRSHKFDSFDMVMASGQKQVIEGAKLETFNNALKKRLLSIAPCGSVFTTKRVGVLAQVTRDLFNRRVIVRAEETKMKKSLPQLRGDNLTKVKEKINQHHALQGALKVILNAIFGITAVPYSRYFNKNISEAITSCGRQTRALGEKAVNELLNEPNKEILDIVASIKRDVENVDR
jgi:DNA polymerase elongation subunit (family B)